MSLLKTIIQKIHFKIKISKVDAVIIYDLEENLIKEWILKPIGITRIIVRNPIDIIISLGVIIFFIKNFKYVIGRRPWRRARFVYEKSLIDVYNPKLVITFRENESILSEVSKIDNNRKYYSIQNSMRHTFDAEAITKSVFNDSNGTNFTLFAWRELDKVVYNEYTDFNCKIIPVGSLRASVSSNYRPQLDGIQNKRYDLCFGSTVGASTSPQQEIDYNAMSQIVVEHLNRYITENDKSLVVSLRTHSEFEINFFRSILGSSAAIMPRNRFRTKSSNYDYGTYHVMAKSELIIFLASSVGHEAIGMGKKALQIDYAKDNKYSHHYFDGFWQLSNSSYEHFAEKVDLIFSMKTNDYRRKIKRHADYLIKYDPDEPTYIKIQKQITQDLNILSK